jgi:hypothetical protein
MAIWTIIRTPLFVDGSGLENAWIGLVGYTDGGVGLSVF